MFSVLGTQQVIRHGPGYGGVGEHVGQYDMNGAITFPHLGQIQPYPYVGVW